MFGTAHAAAGWPLEATGVLAAIVHGLSMVRDRKRQLLPEALAQLEALLGVVDEEVLARPAPFVVLRPPPCCDRPSRLAVHRCRPCERTRGRCPTLVLRLFRHRGRSGPAAR